MPKVSFVQLHFLVCLRQKSNCYQQYFFSLFFYRTKKKIESLRKAFTLQLCQFFLFKGKSYALRKRKPLIVVSFFVKKKLWKRQTFIEISRFKVEIMMANFCNFITIPINNNAFVCRDTKKKTHFLFMFKIAAKNNVIYSIRTRLWRTAFDSFLNLPSWFV